MVCERKVWSNCLKYSGVTNSNNYNLKEYLFGYVICKALCFGCLSLIWRAEKLCKSLKPSCLSWRAKSSSGLLLVVMVMMCYFPVRYKYFKLMYNVVFWRLRILSDSVQWLLLFGYLQSWYLGLGWVWWCWFYFISFWTSDHCFGSLFLVTATLPCTFTRWVWCWVQCHTIGGGLVVATLCSFYFWDFPWYYSRRENTAQMRFCWRNIIISLFLLFWLNHLVRFTHFHRHSVLQVPIHFPLIPNCADQFKIIFLSECLPFARASITSIASITFTVILNYCISSVCGMLWSAALFHDSVYVLKERKCGGEEEGCVKHSRSLFFEYLIKRQSMRVEHVPCRCR